MAIPLNALMGLLAQRQSYGGIQNMPWMPQPQVTPSAAPRETIGPRGEYGRPPQQPQQPLQPQQPQYSSPSQGIFAAYMQNLFNQQYSPPPVQGVYGPTGNGYSGFQSPVMPQIQAPQQPVSQGGLDPYTGLPIWGGIGTEPSGPYVTPKSPVSG